MQPDPIGYEAGLNLYAYVGGDPVNAADPSGLTPQAVICTGTRLGCPVHHDSGGSGLNPASSGSSTGGFGGSGRSGGGGQKDTSNNPDKGGFKNVEIPPLASLADCARGVCGLTHPASIWLGDHDYDAGPNVICASSWKCSATLVGSVYSTVRYAVPGNSSAASVISDNTYTVRQFGIPVGTVTSHVGNGGLTINNITNSGHILYDGWANRNAFQTKDGTWYSYTHGRGTNYFGGMFMAGLNEFFGPGTFDRIDKAIYQELHRRTR